MADTDLLQLDLDILEPEVGTVKLGGKEYQVHPPSVHNVVKLTKIAKLFEEISEKAKAGSPPDTEVVTNAIDDLVDVLEPIIPGLKGGEVELTLKQAGALLGFVFKLSAPPETTELKKVGIEPADTEKKTANGSLS